VVEIKNQVNRDGTVRFDVKGASGESNLILKISENKADVLEIKARDEDIYDGLVKTASAYAFRRGISFNKENILWKQTGCDRQKREQ